MDDKSPQTKIWKAPKGRISTFFSKNKYFKIFGIFISLLVIVFGSFFFAKKYINTNYDPKKGKVVLVIDGSKIYQSDVDPSMEFMMKTLGKNKRDAVSEIIEFYKYKILSERLNITPTKEFVYQNIKTQKEITYKDNASAIGIDEWLDLQSTKSYINFYFNDNLNDDKTFKGYSYVFWFGNRLLKSNEYTPPGGYDNQKLKDEDKGYAKNKAEEIYAKLKNNTITNDNALELANSDPKIGLLYSTDIPLSKKFGFGEKTLWDSQIMYSDVSNFVKKNPRSGLSNIETGSVDSALPGEPEKRIDAYYYFVDNKGENITKQEFIKKLEAMKVVKKI